MALDRWVAQNKGIAVGITVAVVLVVVSVVVNRPSGALKNQRFFYDLQAGALFAADRRAMPPIDAPSGAANGVGAVVLGCGSCDDAADRRPAWLETYTAEAKDAEAQMAAADAETADPATFMARIQAGHLVAAPPAQGEDPKWVGIETDEGRQLLAGQRAAACPGDDAMLCLP